MPTPSSHNIAPIALRIEAACHTIGIGRTSLYKLIGEGKIKTVKLAGRVLILRTEIDRLLADAQAAQ